MKTPICEFVRSYAQSAPLRLHMPGHKGKGTLCEELDITEIEGADSLYEASGVIRESEQNASALFGANTFYSTEGSSLCIRAMVYLAAMHARSMNRRPIIAAARNVHKSFLSALALTDTDVLWLCPSKNVSYLSCPITPDALRAALMSAPELPTAVYITSPDYLGVTADIGAIARVCRELRVLLLVDNAHGAYLRFLSPSAHPMDLGADMCCDSAHKTLPVLTGGAYLHISHGAPKMLLNEAKTALSTFGSTSPSYLILQSLDKANAYLETHRERLGTFLSHVSILKNRLKAHGYRLVGDEPLKLTLDTSAYGYTGTQLCELLAQKNIFCEFADRDYLVMMPTPEISPEELSLIASALLSIPRREAISDIAPAFAMPKRAMSVREAIFSPSERVAAAESEGRILASPTVGCPPAVPLIVSGERIDRHTLELFRYYGVLSCSVVKEY